MNVRILSESAIAHQVAEKAATKVTAHTVRSLLKMTDGLNSGDDSGLVNVWEEICAQVQFERFTMWDVYEHTAQAILASEVESLAAYEREALWLQSIQGIAWDGKEDEQRGAYPVLNSDIVEYLWSNYVIPEADRSSNPRIRAYLDRSTRTD